MAQPGCVPEPAEPGALGGRLRPLACGRTPGHCRQAVGLIPQKRQRDRAAGAAPSAAPTPLTPNTNTNHDPNDQHPQPFDMAASWSAQGNSS